MSGFYRAAVIVGVTPTVRVFTVRCVRPNASYHELRSVVRREWGGGISFVYSAGGFVSSSDWYWETATVYLPRAADLRYVRRVMSLIGWRVERIVQNV